MSNKHGIVYYDYCRLFYKLLLFLFCKLLWLKASDKCINVILHKEKKSDFFSGKLGIFPSFLCFLFFFDIILSIVILIRFSLCNIVNLNIYFLNICMDQKPNKYYHLISVFFSFFYCIVEMRMDGWIQKYT